MADGSTWCRHYHGTHKRCDAGIVPKDDIMPAGQRAIMFKFPCFGEPSPDVACAKYEPYSTEELAEQEKRLQERIAALTEGRCPHCDASVAKRVQVGACVYAKPCGHRLYQGRA